MGGAKGVMGGTDLWGPIPVASSVATTLSSTINPPSVNSQIVCRCMDRGGCGCSRRWLCGFRFCLIRCQTLFGVTVRPLFEVVVALSRGSWDCLSEVWRSGHDFLD